MEARHLRHISNHCSLLTAHYSLLTAHFYLTLRPPRQGHEHELRNNESRKPQERSIRKAIGMQPDAEHVRAEP